MVTTTRRMLEEIRRPELFDAVLEEVARVRAEMGYPILVTPVSQFVANQAARNVIDGERWANVSDETVRYFLGHYGEPPAPPDPDVADRVLARPQAAELRELEPITLEGARERFGHGISDEELLLRLTMPRGAGRRDERGARAARAAAGRRSPARAARHACSAELARRPSIWYFSIGKDGETGGVAPCRLSGSTTCRASCSTSTARSCTASRRPRSAAARRGRSVRAIRASGRPLVLFTNASHVGAETFARGLRADGLPVADDEVLTPIESATTYLRRNHPGARLLAFASDAIRARLGAPGSR